jgi:asparagine synthase (glutamine-hydrolysing)
LGKTLFLHKMCGIAGIYYFDKVVKERFNKEGKLTNLLKHRGPDHQAYQWINNCLLAHTRLSIIDTTVASHQPFHKHNSWLVFNGEVFNYKALQQLYPSLSTSGDVEVLHEHLCQRQDMNMLNGYFAFAFYEKDKNRLQLGRDRFGIKPLYYYLDKEKLAFASELKALLAITGKQELNTDQLYTYFRLNYCAGNDSIFRNIFQLPPGNILTIENNAISISTWYKESEGKSPYQLRDILFDSVKLRLQADVPVGSFLSGGLDSSLISAIAAKHHQEIHTFSIGFKNEHYFDESKYAAMVSRHIGSKHHEIQLSQNDFQENIHEFLNGIDEPFADSSAFNFYMLSKYTQRHVKVSLSGDGADELFKGYHKHKALHYTKSGGRKTIVKLLYPLAKLIRESRDGVMSNKWRQLKKFHQLMHLSGRQQLEFLAQISSHQETEQLFAVSHDNEYFKNLFNTSELFPNNPLHNTFDLQVVLKDDMLVKADRFSMRHGLEIRNPFLDYRVVEYALKLNDNEKINATGQKLILKKTFKDLLPHQIFERRKKGFELPLRKWMMVCLKNDIEHKWFNREMVEQQKLFRFEYISQLKQRAFSANPGDAAAKLWALVVFQNWYLRNKQYIN